MFSALIISTAGYWRTRFSHIVTRYYWKRKLQWWIRSLTRIQLICGLIWNCVRCYSQLLYLLTWNGIGLKSIQYLEAIISRKLIVWSDCSRHSRNCCDYFQANSFSNLQLKYAEKTIIITRLSTEQLYTLPIFV